MARLLMQTAREDDLLERRDLGALAEVGEDPFRLQSILTQRSDFEAVTPEALQQAARRFLVPGRAYRVKAVPGTPIPTAELLKRGASGTSSAGK